MTPYPPTNIPDRLKDSAHVRIRVEGLYPFCRWDMLESAKQVSPPITGPGFREASVQLAQFALSINGGRDIGAERGTIGYPKHSSEGVSDGSGIVNRVGEPSMLAARKRPGLKGIGAHRIIGASGFPVWGKPTLYA